MESVNKFLKEREVILNGITKIIPTDYSEEICFISKEKNVVVHGQPTFKLEGNMLHIVTNEYLTIVEKDFAGHKRNKATLNCDTLQWIEYQIFWELEE